MHGSTTVAAFGAPELLRVQSVMQSKGWAHSYVNKQTGRIRRMFRWGRPRGLVPPGLDHDLSCVDPIRGKSARVKLVPRDQVYAIRDEVSIQVWTMIEIQMLSGCRPGEVVQMRPCGIDQSASPWEYRPFRHKTEHHGHDRVIYLNHAAQAALEALLDGRAPDSPIFSPTEAVQSHHKLRSERRVVPQSCGNRPGSNRVKNPRRSAGQSYTTASYGRAIRRACERAGIPVWSPNRLRHLFATEIRAEHGVDVATTLLGHSRVETTQIYAEKAIDRARDAIAKVDRDGPTLS